MNALNETREGRMALDPIELANRKVLADAAPIALLLAIVLFLGFTVGYHTGFKDGAESFSRTEPSGFLPSGTSETDGAKHQ